MQKYCPAPVEIDEIGAATFVVGGEAAVGGGGAVGHGEGHSAADATSELDSMHVINAMIANLYILSSL
jgi:hypothetical protein